MRLVLLLYVSRSGSTFFASLVARHFSQVLVIPELRLPGLLVKHDVAGSANPRQMLIDLVKLDHQFSALEMSENDVEECIDAMENDYRGEAFLLQIARFLARRNQLEPEVVLYKCGAAGRHWPELRQRMPDMEFIHIYRDPRAAVNSAMRTQRPHHQGKTMGRGDPWLQARRWNTYIDRMNQLDENARLLLQVKYEELCAAPEKVMSEFAEILGLSGPDHGGAELPVSAREESIHANVKHAALPERSLAWQAEMPSWQGLVVEHVTRSVRPADYADYFSSRIVLPMRLACIAYGYCRHRLAEFIFRGQRRRARMTAKTQG